VNAAQEKRREAFHRFRSDPRHFVRAVVLDSIRWLMRHLHSFYAVAGVLLSAALLLAILALWALSGITDDVSEGETLRFDESVLLWMNSVATPWLDVAALHLTVLGGTVVVVTIAVIVATLLWLLDRRRYAALLCIAVGGASVLSPILKQIFDRARPALFDSPAPYVGSPAYPSGHSTMAMVLLVVLAYIVHRLAPGRSLLSVIATSVAALLVLLIGLSRIYLGVHYPTDVVAGYAVGFVWAVFCAIAVEMLSHLRGRAHSERG
jgi:undecaprenyl-diphosphatase